MRPDEMTHYVADYNCDMTIDKTRTSRKKQRPAKPRGPRGDGDERSVLEPAFFAYENKKARSYWGDRDQPLQLMDERRIARSSLGIKLMENSVQSYG